MNTKTSKPRHNRSGSSMRHRSFSSSPVRRGKFQGGRPHRQGGGANRGRRGGGRKMPTFDPSQFINKNPVDATLEEYKPKYKFNEFGLNNKLEKNIASLGMKTPTPIQDQIIPEILKKHDVIGLAETGTGKTAAFLIPLIENTLKYKNRQTLILAPTRELALQIDGELRKLSAGLQIYSVVCVGGINIRPQMKALRRSNQFVIGTPGRILDLIKRKCFLPANITTVVLDEADRMLDMGFIHDIKTILSETPKDKETLFFSATMSSVTDQLVSEFLHNPVTISVKKKDVAGSIKQDVILFEHHAKFEKLLELLSNPKLRRVLIFGSMKHSVKQLAKELSDHNVRSESIHGNKSHIQRQQALCKFKSGNARVLVATDVAARGIHVDNVTHVINYDLPNTFDDYVHRIGRTGRAEKKGEALTFVQSSSSSRR